MNTSTLIEHLIDSGELRGDAICLQTHDEKISFKELVNKVQHIAAYLSDQEINSGDRIVVVIENSIEYVIALYAIWRLGAIAVPLNPQSTIYEIEKIIRQCNAKGVILENLTIDEHELLNKKIQLIISINECDQAEVKKWHEALNNKSVLKNVNIDTASPAQIIYTSGTTGNPKGVVLTHENLMVNTRDIVKYLELTEKDSVLNVLPFHYSYGNSILHTHLYVGAKITLMGSMAFPQEVVNNLRAYKSSMFYGVPSTYALLLSRSDWIQNPPPLRCIAQAGGPMGESQTSEVLSSINTNTKLFVMYGQTEATARISWLPPKSLNVKAGSVGVALDNVSIEIRDNAGCKVGKNITGNVYVTGKSIMQGYWNNETATNKTLYNGWLNTGDIGYLDKDNFLYLAGRKNDMIKVGAHRINPLELEEVINKLEFVYESAVIGIEDKVLGHKLRAFVVGDESKENLFSLKKHCSEYLPTHKIPRDVQWISELPKTSSGKIKRFELL